MRLLRLYSHKVPDQPSCNQIYRPQMWVGDILQREASGKNRFEHRDYWIRLRAARRIEDKPFEPCIIYPWIFCNRSTRFGLLGSK